MGVACDVTEWIDSNKPTTVSVREYDIKWIIMDRNKMFDFLGNILI